MGKSMLGPGPAGEQVLADHPQVIDQRLAPRRRNAGEVLLAELGAELSQLGQRTRGPRPEAQAIRAPKPRLPPQSPAARASTTYPHASQIDPLAFPTSAPEPREATPHTAAALP